VIVQGVDEFAHGDVGEVAAFAVGPFLVLFLEDGADEAGDGVAVGEDLDDVGAAFDLAVEALDGVVRPDLLPVLAGQRANAVRSGSAASSMARSRGTSRGGCR
jgi:hypothetical protein